MKIIIDTREQNPLNFPFYNIVRQKLDEGDYTAQELLDYEQSTGQKTVRIERKGSAVELATNLTRGFSTFEKELQRLFDYERKIILCEFDEGLIHSYPYGSLPKHIIFTKNKKGKYVRRIKVRPQQLLDKIEYIKNIYEVEIVFIGSRDRAQSYVEEVLTNAIEKIS